VKHAELFFTNTFLCCSSDISGSGVIKRPAGEGSNGTAMELTVFWRFLFSQLIVHWTFSYFLCFCCLSFDILKGWQNALLESTWGIEVSILTFVALYLMKNTE
jgi:hypothetical protein